MNITQPISPRRRRISRYGFTIMEVMLAASLSLIVAGGAMWLIVQGMTSSMKVANVSGNDLTQWGLTNRLVLDSRLANALTVYSDFTTAAITAEGTKGIATYTPEVLVGNFLVLSSTSNATDGTSDTTCSNLYGYLYVPVDSGSLKAKTLMKFDYKVEDADITAKLQVDAILKTRMTAIKSKLILVASNIEVAAITPTATTKAAFYWPNQRNIKSDKAILRFNMGDAAKNKRTSDTRLIEVPFYIRP